MLFEQLLDPNYLSSKIGCRYIRRMNNVHCRCTVTKHPARLSVYLELVKIGTKELQVLVTTGHGREHNPRFLTSGRCVSRLLTVVAQERLPSLELPCLAFPRLVSVRVFCALFWDLLSCFGLLGPVFSRAVSLSEGLALITPAGFAFLSAQLSTRCVLFG
ncbi:hypothetical protein ANAPC4_01425 [Anaplasma phagocytophilum]|nr:hypothetical protein ANAPC4_01425 [Anaplasma phagocytophilum]